MKERAIAWARLALVSALPCACADVTEAVSGSAANDAGTSSSGAASIGDGPDDGPLTDDGADTTRGSNGADDAATDPGDTTASPTSGPGDDSSGGTSGGLTSATSTSDGSTDDGGTTMAPVDPCAPDVADSACDTCVKMACCPQVQACFADDGCWCVSSCAGDGTSVYDCFEICGLAQSPPGMAELFMCAGDNCGAECGA